jgi:uncharacterized protein (DUF2249 family)/hemerythrin superfamily protein
MNPVLGTPQRILDVRGFGAAEGQGALFSVFDRLATGEGLLLVSASDPRLLLGALRIERKGLFEWSLLDEGPKSWHVEVVRRDAELGALRGVAEALSWDHDRLDELELRAFVALGAGDLEQARRWWRAFHHGLNRHIRFEEELLFPVFEARAGLPQGGPTAVMRSEHREIRMALEAITRDLEAASADVEELRCGLHRVLEDHNRKEEAILYPAMDRLLSDVEGDALVARIQEFSA